MKEKASSFYIARQISLMIVQVFKVAGDFNQCISVGQTYAMKYLGDHQWLNITEEEGAEINNASKNSYVVIEDIRASKEFAFDLQMYERLPHGHPDKQHQTWLNYVSCNILRKKEQKFKLEVNEEAGRRYGELGNRWK